MANATDGLKPSVFAPARSMTRPWLVPVAHFFTRSAQPWVQPAPGAQRFETQPNGCGSLLPACRARWTDPAD
jgi:hypothetical protein